MSSYTYSPNDNIFAPEPPGFHTISQFSGPPVYMQGPNFTVPPQYAQQPIHQRGPFAPRVQSPEYASSYNAPKCKQNFEKCAVCNKNIGNECSFKADSPDVHMKMCNQTGKFCHCKYMDKISQISGETIDFINKQMTFYVDKINEVALNFSYLEQRMTAMENENVVLKKRVQTLEQKKYSKKNGNSYSHDVGASHKNANVSNNPQTPRENPKPKYDYPKHKKQTSPKKEETKSESTVDKSVPPSHPPPPPPPGKKILATPPIANSVVPAPIATPRVLPTPPVANNTIVKKEDLAPQMQNTEYNTTVNTPKVAFNQKRFEEIMNKVNNMKKI